jgi:hypothetical protein
LKYVENRRMTAAPKRLGRGRFISKELSNLRPRLMGTELLYCSVAEPNLKMVRGQVRASRVTGCTLKGCLSIFKELNRNGAGLSCIVLQRRKIRRFSSQNRGKRTAGCGAASVGALPPYY